MKEGQGLRDKKAEGIEEVRGEILVGKLCSS
jgi:hypothetical protein